MAIFQFLLTIKVNIEIIVKVLLWPNQYYWADYEHLAWKLIFHS